MEILSNLLKLTRLENEYSHILRNNVIVSEDVYTMAPEEYNGGLGTQQRVQYLRVWMRPWVPPPAPWREKKKTNGVEKFLVPSDTEASVKS